MLGRPGEDRVPDHWSATRRSPWRCAAEVHHRARGALELGADPAGDGNAERRGAGVEPGLRCGSAGLPAALCGLRASLPTAERGLEARLVAIQAGLEARLVSIQARLD